MKYRTLAAALLLGSVMFTSCVDEFSELNSDPSTITKPDIRFLFTKCEASFQPGDYAQWFGGFNDLSTWSQTTVSSGGNTTRSNRPTDEANGCGYEVNEVLHQDIGRIFYSGETGFDQCKARLHEEYQHGCKQHPYSVQSVGQFT